MEKNLESIRAMLRSLEQELDLVVSEYDRAMQKVKQTAEEKGVSFAESEQLVGNTVDLSRTLAEILRIQAQAQLLRDQLRDKEK